MDYNDDYVSDYLGEALGGRIKKGGKITCGKNPKPKGGTSEWICEVKKHARDENMSYKEALQDLKGSRGPQPQKKVSKKKICKDRGAFRYAGTGRCRFPCKKDSEYVDDDNLCKPARTVYEKNRSALQRRLSGYGYYSDSDLEGGALKKCKSGYARSRKTKRCRKKCKSGYTRSRVTDRCRKTSSKRRKSSKRKSSRKRTSKRKSSKRKSSRKCKRGSYKSPTTKRCRKVCKKGSYKTKKGSCKKSSTTYGKKIERKQRRKAYGGALGGALGGCGCCGGSGLMQNYRGGLFDCPQCMGNALGGSLVV
jgi:hypothetical protein